MIKLATLTSMALLLTAGYAAAQSATTSSPPSAVLMPDQCNEIWSKVTKGTQAGAGSNVSTFAQVDDLTQVDTNKDGMVDKEEFVAACGKGLVHEPPRVKE